MNNFAVFILSHGRADNVRTIQALKKSEYNGKIYIIIDNEDKTQHEYLSAFDNVIIFNKLDISKRYDQGDNFDNRKSIFYARNASYEIAKELKLKYFLQLDDDYNLFEHRFIKNGKLMTKNVKNINLIFELMINFLEETGCKTIAFAQGGDFIGGRNNANFKKGILRKAMNTFFCKTDNPINFVGRINEDVNTYTYRGSQGDLFFTVTAVNITQAQTQKNKGGMTDLYLDSGTYVKSFYSIMWMPSAVKIGIIGHNNLRLHHKINWDACTPKILREEWS
jgi:hypothetical protein